MLVDRGEDWREDRSVKMGYVDFLFSVKEDLLFKL